MGRKSEKIRKRHEPDKPNREAGKSEQDPKVPPASEIWVEGQPASDADYRPPSEP